MTGVPAKRLEGAADRRLRVVTAGHRAQVDIAREGLSDSEASVRAAALGALDRSGALAAQTLQAALDDRDPLVRRRAAELAAHHADVDLLKCLDDSDPLVVEAAAWSMGERASTSSVPALSVVTASHPDPLCREAAVASLGAIGDESGLPAILRSLQDVVTVRRRAVLALAPFDGPEVRQAINKALSDKDWQVRQAAEDLSSP